MKTRGTLIRRQECQVGRARRWAGFSLIELMTVLAVAAIALMIAVPGMSSVLNSNRLTAAANGLVAAITQARIQAIKRNVTTQFCSDSSDNNNTDALGTACSGSSGGLGAVIWTDGLSTPTQTAVLGAVALPPKVTVAGATALRFSGNGLATSGWGSGSYSGLVADVYNSSISQRNHRCIYLTTGTIVSVCTVTGNDGACPTNEPHPCQS